MGAVPCLHGIGIDPCLYRRQVKPFTLVVEAVSLWETP
jgi:hypothetical protein